MKVKTLLESYEGDLNEFWIYEERNGSRELIGKSLSSETVLRMWGQNKVKKFNICVDDKDPDWNILILVIK